MADGGFNPLPVGTIVHQRYRITAVVGRGGLGTVYQVVDVLFGKSNVYALKELIDQSSGARKQFENESQWLQSLDHNSIPKVREHFDWQGRLYLVMDFVDGENLEQKLARNGGRPLPEQDVVRWILPICDALNYLHTRNPPILHRDVKPANIIVTPVGHPVLVDLGIAKEHLPGAGQTATFVRKAGTEGYAPPEQYAAAGQTGPWSDVYGVGATLYQLLTGKVPPTAVERVALDARLLTPRALNASLSPAVDAAIARSLSLRPSERFQSLPDLARALTGPGTGTFATGAPATGSVKLGTAAPPSTPSRSPVPPSPSAPSSPRPAVGRPLDAPLPSLSPQSPLSPPSSPSARRNAPPPAPPATRPLTPIPSPISRAGPTTPAGMAISRPGASGDAGNLSGEARQRATEATSAVQSAARLNSQVDLGARTGEIPALHARSTAKKRRRLTRKRVLLGSGLVCVALVAAVVAVLVLNATALPDRSSPQATVTGYFAALKAQDYQRAWLYDAQSRTEVSNETAFIDNLKADDARFGRVVNAHITQLDNTEGTAQVDVTRAHSPVVMSYSLNLMQFDNDTWLITDISGTS